MVTRRVHTAERRRDARRGALLDAAIRLFARYGYNTTTVSMIVREAHSSIGSFYVHFRNKEDVFETAIRSFADEALPAPFAARSEGKGARKTLFAGCQELFLQFAQHKELARLLQLDVQGTPSNAELMRHKIVSSKRREVEEMLRELYPRLAPERIKATACCVLGAILGTYYCWAAGEPAADLPEEEMANLVAQFSVRAIGDL
ncbi:MAG: helix-turn-helix domain containing protein [Terracidiphilus sp.]|nr:helix-turn-helix domain containing protein [Terracidiphilus sp.]